MKRIRNRIVTLLAALTCAATIHAQDFDSVQIHGFATQGLLWSAHNNYLIENTRSGQADWTEAAISFTDRPIEHLRIGLQLHYYELSDLGNPYPTIDWALGDYEIKPFLGIRAGKVKTPIGLFNDTQDVDPVLLWSLLPQSIYALDNRNFYLSHYGGEIYGSVSPGQHSGKISYRFFGGPSKLPLVGGYGEQLATLTGLNFTEDLPVKMEGVDLRWQTPMKPLVLGVGFVHTTTVGTANNGSISIRSAMPVFYGQYERGKFYAAGEYRRQTDHSVAMIGPYTVATPYDLRSWYAMAAYRLTAKLQMGSYYSHYVAYPGVPSYAANNSKDLVLSGRYDFNGNFYAKAETHFVHGEAVGYYADDNPNGLVPRANLMLGKLGFSF